jgi:uncharacterized membrane protein
VKHSSEKEIFWKVLVWRLGFSMPLTMLVNYIYFHSISVVVGMTIVSNIIGYVAHYFFEMGWPRMWRFASGRMKIKRNKNIEETR